ncbi:MAG TPA: NAD+ synthase [Alphaproteobacteria bacterium]|nr:NAD+ synthase [Alphaproteobacteria bacterium]
MTDTLIIALAQINPTVGDIAGNIAKLGAARDAAARAGADLVVASELAVSGYPPEDLVLRPAFLSRVKDAVEAFARDSAKGPAMVVGAPWLDEAGLHNAVLLLDGGKVVAVRAKWDLPNYGVFDEKRVFKPGPLPEPVAFRGRKLGLLVCEDMWTPTVAGHLKSRGADILIVPNGSPFEVGKVARRAELARNRVIETGLPLIYVNQIGGQDELVFDGASFALSADGTMAARLPAFVEHSSTVTWNGAVLSGGEMAEALDDLPAIYAAMTLGLRDYVEKNGFPGVLLGLSGGIDSAISAAVAVDALGPKRVHCVMMPSPYTSRESLDDAEAVAHALSVRLDSVSIEPAMQAFGSMLAPSFAGTQPNITEENIQARARGITLMALSNKFGHMVLSTGNKSEMSVGYATLYGDMCGGFNVLKDVYKTQVFALCRWRNAHMLQDAKGPHAAVIPERVITKPPTAELRPNQKDEDSLPPYATLDAILALLIEGDMGVEDVAAQGFDRATVARVWRMLTLAEYKRRQAPPGVKITRRTLSRERRYPITNRFDEAGS